MFALDTKRNRRLLPTHRLAYATVGLVLVGSMVGCGDGSVVANGTVTVGGSPVSGGRLSVTPVGGGPRFFSGVGQDGTFILRNAEMNGALPGTYRISFRQPIDGKMKAKIAPSLKAVGASVDEYTLSYEAPANLTLTIPESGSESLEIAIDMKAGWRRTFIE